MMAAERQRHMLEQLKQHGAVRISAVAGESGVSEMTVQRDLNALDGRDLIRKVHGGAVVRHFVEVPWADRAGLNRQAKVAVARRAHGQQRL